MPLPTVRVTLAAKFACAFVVLQAMSTKVGPSPVTLVTIVPAPLTPSYLPGGKILNEIAIWPPPKTLVTPTPLFYTARPST